MRKPILLFLLMIVLVCIIIVIFFNKNMSKVFKNGNNMSSQEIVDYVLNISSYKANISVEINSNKNSNKYILNQEYISPNTNKQEVIEPSNISGVKLTRDENGLTVENTRLDLSTIYENYDYIADNCLDLSCFINDYKTSNKSTCEEKDNQVIMKTESNNENIYTKSKKLYIDKESLKPVRLEIKDNNKKTTVNILYNEVEVIEQNQ
ncbi:MAG: hypothetical protein IKF17_00155 [Clostridia bacterium]|nr:hypothetical protein [Clostridia bacterium]